MSEREPHRRPATFKLDDPHVIVMDPDGDPSRPSRGTVHITPEADPALLPVPVEEPVVPLRRGFRWGALFWSAEFIEMVNWGVARITMPTGSTRVPPMRGPAVNRNEPSRPAVIPATSRTV